MTGMKFGRWNVLSKHGKKNGEITWLCECECGNTGIIKGGDLRSGKSQSCGCLRRELGSPNYVHGMTGTKIYKMWKNMKARCYNPSTGKDFINYGERGITVCDEWRDSFQNFCDWAMKNGYRDGLTIERIDVNKGYEPSNCTFIPMSEQPVNRRNTLLTINGVTKPKKEWAKEAGINLRTLSSRINKLGWTPERAVSIPARGKDG